MPYEIDWEDRGRVSRFRGAEDMQLMKTFAGASVKARGSVEYFDNYDAARAWAELPEDYPDPFEDTW